MPKKIQFAKNSIIYFRGEESREIFLISEGDVQITSTLLGVEKRKRYSKGDFFGLHSAIGEIGRNDDAMSLTNVSLISFNVKEFEGLITKNPKLSLQLMQMLSHELRQVHQKTKSVMKVSSNVSPETGLYLYAKTYYEKSENEKALYVLKKYAELYSSGEYMSEVSNMLKDIKNRGS